MRLPHRQQKQVGKIGLINDRLHRHVGGLAALVVEGVTYRNDGSGWYETSQPPGIGLDPASARLLPGMLRNVEGAADAPASDETTDALTARLAALDPARTLAGTAKLTAWFALRDRGWKQKLWAQRSKAVPINDEDHRAAAHRYILRHREVGAWVWEDGDGAHGT